MTTQNLPPYRKLTSTEIRAILYIFTLVLAAMAIIFAVYSPVVWTFLGLAIGALYRQTER